MLFRSDESAVRKNLQELLSDEKGFELERRKFMKELSFYESNDECPTCKQDIESEHKNHICDDTTTNIKVLDKQLSERSIDKPLAADVSLSSEYILEFH